MKVGEEQGPVRRGPPPRYLHGAAAAAAIKQRAPLRN